MTGPRGQRAQPTEPKQLADDESGTAETPTNDEIGLVTPTDTGKRPSLPETGARAREWRTSSARMRVRARYTLPYFIGSLGGLGGLVIALSSGSFAPSWGVSQGFLVVGGIAIALVGGSIGAYSIFQIDAARAAFYEDIERQARGELAEAIGEITDAGDLLGLIRANRKQMDAYDAIARSQAATSYRSSQLAMAMGLVVLGVGIVIAIFSDTPSTKYSAAFLTAVGTGVGGYISRTFIAVQERAMEQMNFYFQQPLVQSYLLTAERLVQQMQPTDRAHALDQIVTSIVDQLLRPSSGSKFEKKAGDAS